MVKGKTNVRLNFLSPKTGTQECEANLHEAAAAMAATAAARPPLSALSAGARNILASISNAPSSSTNVQPKDGEKLLLSPEIKSFVTRSAGASATTSHEEEEEEEEEKKYPHLENSSTISNNNVKEHTTPAAGHRTPDPFLTSTAAIPKPSTQQRRRASWVPTPPKAAAKNVEAAPRRSSFAGTLRHSAVARALSSSFGGGGMGEESMTSSTSTSDFSDPESIHSSSLSQATTRSTHKRRATKQHKKSVTTRAAQEFLPGVLNAAAAGEFQKTPSRALKPWRNGPFGTTAAATSSSSTPGNIRSMAAGMPRGSGLLHQQQQQLSNLSQNSRDMDFELEEDPCFWNDHHVQVHFSHFPPSDFSGFLAHFEKLERSLEKHFYMQ